MATIESFISSRIVEASGRLLKIDAHNGFHVDHLAEIESVISTLTNIKNAAKRHCATPACFLDDPEPSQYETPGSSGNGGTPVDGYAPPPEPVRPPSGTFAETFAAMG